MTRQQNPAKQSNTQLCWYTTPQRKALSGTSYLMSFVKIRCKSWAVRELPGMTAKPAALSLSSKLCVMHETYVCTLTATQWSQRFWIISHNLQSPSLGRSPDHLHRHGQRMFSREGVWPSLYLQNICTQSIRSGQEGCQQHQLINTFDIPKGWSSSLEGLTGVTPPYILEATWPPRIAGYDLQSSDLGIWQAPSSSAGRSQIPFAEGAI